MARSGRRRRPAGALRLPARPSGAAKLTTFFTEPDLSDASSLTILPAEPTPSLELEISPADIPRLLRLPGLQSRRAGRARAYSAHTVWHDTAGGELAARDLVLSQSRDRGRDRWRLERLRPNGALDWLPACPAPVLCEAETLADIQPGGAAPLLPEKLAAVAAFAGRLREYQLDDPSGPASLGILEGTLRGVAHDRAACRVILSGAPAAMARLAVHLAEGVRLTVPRAGLAAQALQVARGVAPAPRHAGAPSLPPHLSAGDALGHVCAHLADVILHWASRISEDGGAEPVHQMRVGVRRLRSALSVFRRAAQGEAANCPWLDELAGQLKRLAAALGVARDWDVFLAETAAEIRAVFPNDRRILQVIGAAERKRAAAYAALSELFSEHDWRRLELGLALLPTVRPWREAGGTALDAPLRDYAPPALDRHARQLLRYGADISALPAEQLHDLRKRAKRLRYAVEILAPLFAGKAVRKYLKGLEVLQERLGAINDAAVAAALMQQMGGGADRAYAAGLVQGFGAARTLRAHGKLQAVWCRFTKAAPFWD